MSLYSDKLQRILPRVQKPARYTGGEFGQTVKDPETVETRLALCFPDTYEIGMSNLGMRILYGAANARDDVWCERVYAPGGYGGADALGRDPALRAGERGSRAGFPRDRFFPWL